MAGKLVKASIILKTGHRLAFECEGFRKIPGGFEFLDYPEDRGRMQVRFVRADVVASIEIEAPNALVDGINLIDEPAPAVVGPVRAAAKHDYPEGDPQHGATPQTYVASRANRARLVKNDHGIPQSEIVGEDGEVAVVDAAMVKM